MADDLRDGDDGTEVFVFLEVGQLLGQDDDVGELDYLRGLDAYAEEAQPAVVARVALGAEEDERDEQGGAQAVEPYPVLREDVHVYDCDGDEKQDAQHQRQALDDDVLRASVVVGLRSARDDYDAVYSADDADSEEKHVRPAHEVAQLGQDFFQGAHLGTGKCGNMGL